MSSTTLSAQQATALFSILTHTQLSQEISKFTYPTGIDNYGAPFDSGDSSHSKNASSSPILQSLVSKFVLPLPGLRNVDKRFWTERAGMLVKKLGEAALSESYDKGQVGSRRVLAVASAVVLEGPGRGVLGGLDVTEKSGEKSTQQEYDLEDPDDVLRGWNDFLQGLVYGDLIDEVFEKTAESGDLSKHSPMVRAAHEYLIINLATFLHYVMIHSPDGPYLARTIESVHKMVPYTMMRSTLRVGNAATMINGMIRIFLTKLSLGAITNWFGLSKGADDGMNLLQTIISTVINWDINELKKQASKLKSSKEAPSDKHLKSVAAHLQKPREEHDKARDRSMKESKSLVAIIFEDDGIPIDKLTDAQHTVALDYLSLQLSIRDREQLIKVGCNLQPDILTQGIKDLVAAYDPILRGVHSAADLSTGMWDFENFLTDLIKLSKPQTVSEKSAKKGKTPQLPCVEEYVKLLRKHMPGAHKFAHQIAKNGKDVAAQYKEYVKTATKEFQRKGADHGKSTASAGQMTEELNKLVADLPEEKRKNVLNALDEYAAYSTAIECSSRDRLSSVLAPTSNTKPSSTNNSRPSSSHSSSSVSSFTLRGSQGTAFGPGMYLPRLQQLIDQTPITPKTAEGPVRHGSDRSVRDKEAIDVDGSKKVTAVVSAEELGMKSPDVSVIVDALGSGFEKCLRDR